jgi:hypothetical protein
VCDCVEFTARLLDRVVSERMHDLGTIEESTLLLRREAILDVTIAENLGQSAPARVFADDICRDTILGARPSEEECKGAAQQARESLHQSDCILRSVRRKSTAGRFAERELAGIDDAGAEERVVIWIERKSGGVWAVGRVVNPQQRTSQEPRRDDYVFEGYELEDALEVANGTLEDDVRVLEQDGRDEKVRPFVREELLKPLERYFFGRTQAS